MSIVCMEFNVKKENNGPAAAEVAASISQNTVN
jgi:hypothetical protein